MGSAGWRVVRTAFKLHRAPRIISHAAGSCWTAQNQIRVFAVGHCGPLGVINRPWPQQIADWRRIGAAVSVCHPTGAELRSARMEKTNFDEGRSHAHEL
jgi:hypothetical protein